VSAWNGGAGYLPPAGSGKHTHLNGGQGLANSAASGIYESGWSSLDNASIQPTNANLACDANQNYNTWTPAAATHEKLPVNCVNWPEAYAFCIWDGGFLPSEAEWEFAAAAGNLQREYPWGSADPGTANQYAIYGFHYVNGTLNIAPVDSAPQGAGFWGHLNLAGNVFQWSADWYATYATCVDCANLTPGQQRVLRGGDWNLDPSSLQPPYRYSLPPGIRNNGIGIRCARTP
jgi:formylglycine-generating enzyme required for sulfatase activity